MSRKTMRGASGPSCTCKRVILVVCAIANLGVFLYMLYTLLQPSSSSSHFVDYVRTWHPADGFSSRSISRMPRIEAEEAGNLLSSKPFGLTQRLKQIRDQVAMDGTASKSKRNGLQKLGRSTDQDDVGFALQAAIDREEQDGRLGFEGDDAFSTR